MIAEVHYQCYLEGHYLGTKNVVYNRLTVCFKPLLVVDHTKNRLIQVTMAPIRVIKVPETLSRVV